jgi:hypothetical protein
MKPSDLEALKRRQRKRQARHLMAAEGGRVQKHTVELVNGRPTPQSQAILDELQVGPAFVGETMRCEICGAIALSHPEVESDWRALDADGQRSYFCPAEFPPDPAGAGDYQLAYERALIFALARRDEKLREVIRAKGLDRPIHWRSR